MLQAQMLQEFEQGPPNPGSVGESLADENVD